MMSRRKARESALQALYQCDTLGEWTEARMNIYFEVFQPGNLPADAVAPNSDSAESEAPQGQESENLEFCKSIILGVLAHRAEIDGKLGSASVHWSISRMTRVDRNILRVACYEMLFCPEIPLNVSINEAIEIAKAYGTEDSPMFVNGVLDKVAKNLPHTRGAHPKASEEAA